MRQSYIIFNVVGLTVAIIFCLSAFGQLRGGYPPGLLIWTGTVILLIGGGSLANLFEGGLTYRSTVIVIAGYCISIFLIPFAIWGIVLLVLQRKRRERRSRCLNKSRQHSR